MDKMLTFSLFQGVEKQQNKADSLADKMQESSLNVSNEIPKQSTESKSQHIIPVTWPITRSKLSQRRKQLSCEMKTDRRPRNWSIALPSPDYPDSTILS